MSPEALTPEEWESRLAYWLEEEWVAEKHLEVAEKEIARCYLHLGQLALFE